MKKLSITLFLVFLVSAAMAQKNILNQRSFWKNKPSLAAVKDAIDQGNNPAELNNASFDAVSWAIIEDNSLDVIKHLLSLDGNGVNKRTHDGRTYVFWAGYRNNIELMKYLVSKGAKTDIIDSHGYSLVNFMATSGVTNIEAYDFCLKHGANFKKDINSSGANPVLLLMPSMEDDKLITYFAKYGVLHTALDSNGNNAFAYAAKKGNITMMNWLLKHDVETDEHAKNAFLFAAKGTRKHKNNREVYEYLFKKGINPLLKDEKGNDPLHYVATYGTKEQIEWFISKGAKLTNKNKKNVTSFMQAMYNNNLQTIEFLVNQKFEVDQKDNKRQTALIHLFLSFNKNNQEAFQAKLRLLEKHESYKNVVTNDGNNLFHIAVEKDAPQLLEIASKYKADINLVNKDDLTPLQLACNIGMNLRIIKHLYKMGANKTKKTAFGETAYDLAKENERLKDQNIEFLK